MTNSQNLETLIREHEALKAEVERLRQLIEDFRQIANIPPSNLVVSTQHPKIIREMTAAIRDTYAKYANQASAAEVEALAPKPFPQPEITLGMDVYDSDGVRVGSVEHISASKGADGTSIEAMIEHVSEGLNGRKDLPEVLIKKLYTEGFILVNRGLLRLNAVVFPSQINDIGEESLYLRIEHSEVTKLR